MKKTCVLHYTGRFLECLSDNTVRYYYYERDHQGSVRTVRDASFGVVQSTAYTASGLPMTRIYSGVGDHHLHTGKPWQDTGGLAWYNNRARWYDPITMRFLAPDPLADKYHDISPWAWCGNNPLRYVDLNGKDNYAIDRIGNISLLNKNDDPLDCIFSPNNSSFIIVSKSFIKSQNNEVVKTINSYSNDCEEVLVTTFSSNNLRYVYEFMKDNTDVEWSFVKTENNNIETNYIGTSHIDGVDVSQEYIVKKISSNDNVIELRHVHPNGSLTVSLGDVDVAKLIQTSFPDARFFIDIPFSDENKQYDSKSTPGLLPELIVIP